MSARRADGAARPAEGERGPYGKTMRPVGSEYRGKDGMPMVKVAMWPTVPGSKDNWRPKSAVEWERANGRPLPEGHVVVFADRDRSNFAPDNLFAVPRALLGPLNNHPWEGRDGFLAALALTRLEVAAKDAAARRELECARCGARFAPFGSNARNVSHPPRLCPACRDEFMRVHNRKGARA